MTVREIASPANPLIKSVKALHLKKRREETGLFLAEGARIVMEGFDCGFAPKTLIYARTARDSDIVEKLRSRTIKAGGEAAEVSEGALAKIARKDNPQSVVGVFEQRYRPLPELNSKSAAIWVALEGVKDPGNLGTVIRTADAVAAGGVILVGDTCDPFSVESVRATMGSIFAVAIFRASLIEFLALSRDWPGLAVGTALQTETDYRSVDYATPTLLVMGAEQSGLSDAARSACGALVRLPMKGRADSLNLAVSAGVMLYHIASAHER